MVEGDGEEEGAGREAGVEESKTAARANATATALQTLDEVKHIRCLNVHLSFTYHVAQMRRSVRHGCVRCASTALCSLTAHSSVPPVLS